MEIDFEDIENSTTLYGDSQLIYMGTSNGLPIVWKPSGQTDEDNLVSELFSRISTKQDDLNAILGKQGFQFASTEAQDLHSYVLLTGNKPPGQNGPHKDGEGGYASGRVTVGIISIIGGGILCVIPGCQGPGKALITIGVGLIAQDGANKVNEKRDNR